MTEVQWSQLQRDPKKVAELAETHIEVRVTRRDGPDLVLSRADRIEASREAVRGAAALLSVIARRVAHDPVAVFECFEAAFPWARFLPRHELKEFADEFLNYFEASADLASWNHIEQLIREWRATAAIYADRRLAETLRRPLDVDLGPVMPPNHAEAG